MNIFYKWISRIHTQKIKSRQLIEENRKRIYVFVCITIAIPVFIGYGLNYLINKNLLIDAYLNFAVAACLLAIAILMKTTTLGRVIYRFGIAGVATLLIYNVGFGPYGESEALWLIVFPLATFYLFGTREGIAWIVVVILPSAIFVYSPGFFNTYSYPIQFRTALFVAVSLSVILSYILESLRAHFISQIEQKNTELLNALAEVKKLSGLIPICSSCKKIRDDKGFWNQIEIYIRDHSEAEFTHGICPECVEKLYPDTDYL